MYYGQDGNDVTTGCVYPCGNTFYIGGIGGGVTEGGEPYSSSLASAASYIYTYWVVLGPLANPSLTPFQWGQQQAATANSTFLSWPQRNRNTLFADVEVTNDWSSTVSDNQEVIKGWFSQAVSFTYGVYTTQSQWQTITGGMNLSQFGSVYVWSADDAGSTPPCGSPPNCPTAFPSLPDIGGISPVFWQYVSATPTSNISDYDAALTIIE